MPLILRSKTIKDNELTPAPPYLKSPSGGPYTSRMRRINSKQSILKVVKELTFTGKTKYDGYNYTFYKEIKHNLGKLAYPVGHLFLGNNFFPIPFPGSTGIDVTITFYFVEKDRLVLYIRSTVFWGEQDVRARIYLLRETLN